MYSRWILALALLVALVLPTSPALAWTEWHEHTNQVRVELGRSGTAQVEHTLRYRIVMGPLKSIDLAGVPTSAILDEQAVVVADDSSVTEPLSLVFLPDDPKLPNPTKTVRATVADPKGLKRGKYTFTLRYHLPTAGLLEHDGAVLRLRWSQAASPEGSDGAKITFVVPTAPMEPRLMEEGATWLVNQARGTSTDEVRLERAHVAKGEIATAILRLDPRAMDAESKPAAAPLPSQLEEHETRLPALALALGGLLAALSAFGLIRAHSMRAGFAAHSLTHALFGLATGAALVAACMGLFRAHAAALAVATLACALRKGSANHDTSVQHARWVPLRESDAFTPLAPALPFAAAAYGKWMRALLVLVLLAGAAAILLHSVNAAAACFALGFAAPLVLLAAMDGPRGIAARRRAVLRDYLDELAADAGSLRAVPIAPLAAESLSDLRLRIVPRAAIAGLSSIELGFAADASQLAIVLRAREGSSAARRLNALVPGGAGPGRVAGEHAVVLEPKAPMRSAVLHLVRLVARALQERRGAPVLFRGRERRSNAARLQPQTA
jgi:hypothetical protein